jgi:hypothetical protein
MKLPHVRFTLRCMMIAVLALGLYAYPFIALIESVTTAP